MSAPDRPTTPGVEMWIAEGVLATLAWINPGWRIRQVQRDHAHELPISSEDAQRTFATVIEAVDHLRRTYERAEPTGD